jgi:hypothetical protein
MQRKGDEVHIDANEARAGSTPHVVRWILLASTAILVILYAITFVIGADAARDGRDSANVTTEEVAKPDAS